MGGKNLNCQMQIAFHETQDGRPEIYDFVWEHAPALFTQLGEKKIQLRVQPRATREKWAAEVGMKNEELQFLVQKLLEDKRFAFKARMNTTTHQPTFEMDVPSKELDHVLNTYNIFISHFLPYMQLEGKDVAIDFSSAAENKITCRTLSKHKPKVSAFLTQRLTQRPRIQTILFEKKKRGR